MSLEGTEEDKSWAGAAKSELFVKLNAGRRKPPNAGRRQVMITSTVCLIPEQPAVLILQDRRRRSSDEARLSSPEPDEPGLAQEQAGHIFDIGGIVRALKVCKPAQARLSHRKLHMRRWHAQAATMDRILRRVGVPREVCD